MKSMTGFVFFEFSTHSFRYHIFSVKQIDYFQRTLSFLTAEIDDVKKRRRYFGTTGKYFKLAYKRICFYQ